MIVAYMWWSSSVTQIAATTLPLNCFEGHLTLPTAKHKWRSQLHGVRGSKMAARTTGVAVTTARSQLTVFGKTGTNHQAELVALVHRTLTDETRLIIDHVRFALRERALLASVSALRGSPISVPGPIAPV